MEQSGGSSQHGGHYLLVLIDSAGSVRPRGDLIKLVLTALAIVCVALIVILYLVDRQ